METRDVFALAKERKKGQRRLDLFRRDNLETWILYFPPGDVQRMHNHPSDRTYYVLSGRGEMTMDGKTFEVKPGDAILTRPGASHGLKQIGKEDLVIMINYEQVPKPQ